MDYARGMRRLLPILLLSACDTPGTFGTDLFGTQDPLDPNEAAMIADLEREPELEATTPPERELAKVPTLPSSTWIQVFDRSARIAHRIHDDGRYTVQFGEGEAQEMPIISRSAPERRELSDDARTRILDALEAVRFPSMAPHITEVEQPPSEGVMVVQLHPMAITVRNPETGIVHTVHAKADVRVAETFGPLSPLWQTLDDEIFGRWLEAAVAGAATSPPG